jgi:hypothetical protein
MIDSSAGVWVTASRADENSNEIDMREIWDLGHIWADLFSKFCNSEHVASLYDIIMFLGSYIGTRR